MYHVVSAFNPETSLRSLALPKFLRDSLNQIIAYECLTDSFARPH
jgi:hypothetical protein